MSAGQYIHDTNKAIWLRTGANIQHFSAMCVFDGQLVLGSGYDGALTDVYANIQFADWDTKTELGVYSATSGSWGAEDITSAYFTKNDDLGYPDIKKQISDIVLVSRDNDASGWTSTEDISLYYRLDEGDWTLVDDGNTRTVRHDASDKKITISPFRKVLGAAYNIQFKVETTSFFESLKIMFYWQILTKQ